MIHNLRTIAKVSLCLSFFLARPDGLRALETPSSSAPRAGEPTDPKARKTYASAMGWEKKGNSGAALDAFRKANKQDGGNCWNCLDSAFGLAMKIGEFKDAEEIARQWLPVAQTNAEKASVHFGLGVALQEQGRSSKKDKFFSESCDEFKFALALNPRFVSIHYSLGISLAQLQQDDAARAEFSTFLEKDKLSPALHLRAERYIERIELARAVMAPPFSIVTLDGQHISMDSLVGKVVLIDFWATWCGPCREALPHIRQIAKKFAGQPLVVLSISLDSDDAAWRQFAEKNEMTWLQYRDGSSDGKISKQFNVHAIPATFTIDADGVLEDQHVGDADIEGKLKKLVARAVEAANRKPVLNPVSTPDKTSGSSE